MRKKAKKFFATMLAISMGMSQLSVLSYADELINATDANAIYKVTSNSNSTYEVVTGSNTTLNMEEIAITGQQSALLKMLPETVEVTDLRLLSVIDGTPDFDADNAPGHDNADNNGILRTLDTVTYNLRMAIQEPENPKYKDATDEIQIKAVVPGVKSREVQFLTDSMHWLYDAEVEETDEGLVLTGYTMVDTNKNSVYWQDIAVSMKAYHMDQGESFAPEFYAWIDGQEEPVSVTNGTGVIISAKEALNISLLYDEEDKIGYYDLSMDPSVKNEKYGAMFGLTVRVELMSETNDLKGVRIPNEDITFDIDMSVFNARTNPATDVTTEHVPLLWDYSQSRTGQETTGTIGRDLVGKITGKKLLPFGSYNKAEPEKSVYESGNLTIVQDGTMLHVTIKDYEFGPEINFPKQTQYGNVYTSTSNKGAFSTALLQLLVPYENVPDTLLYTLSTEVKNLTLDGRGIEQTEASDDIATRQVQSVDGSWNQRVMVSHLEEFSDDITSISLGATAQSGVNQGNYYAYPGEQIYLTGFFTAYWDEYYANGTDYLLKVPGEFELPDLEDINIYCLSSNVYDNQYTMNKLEYAFNDKKVRYAAKPDGSAWSSEREMDDTLVHEMVYYDSKEEAKDAGAEILGLLFEIRAEEGYYRQFRHAYVVPVKVSETATEDYVYPVYFEHIFYKIYTPANGYGMTLNQGVAHINDTELDEGNKIVKDYHEYALYEFGPEGVTHNNVLHYRKWVNYISNNCHFIMTPFIYVKSDYENGQVKAGTHVTKTSYSGTMNGQFGGTSILVVGTQAGIEKEVEQLGTDGKSRSVFNLNQGQREVDYILKPTYKFPVEYLLKQETDTLTITDTLDNGLTYLEGSAYQGGTYDTETETLADGIALEPAITEDNEGRQVLTWVLPDVKAGEEIDPIHYSATIDSGVGNGTLLMNTAKVSAPSDERPITEAAGKVSAASIHVVQSRGSYLNKSVDKEYAELADEIIYKVTFNNNGNDTYEDILIKDILPYEGDGRGTDFKGASFKVSSITVSTASNAEVYVTTMKQNQIAAISEMYNDNDSWNGWVKLEAGVPLDEVTAIACKDDVPAEQELTIEIAVQISCPETRALFVNNAEAYTNNHQQLTSLDVRTTVLPRKVSGLVWFDTDRDGIREREEKLLAGVKVALLDKDGNAVNDIYGNPVNVVVTGADGTYQFDNLEAGEYQVRFESDTYKLDELLVAVKDSATAGDEWDSDADGVYEDETLKAAVISGIKLPELSAIVEKKLDEWHEAYLDVGFHSSEPDETESDPTESNPTESDPTESDPSESESNEPESSEPESSESETTEPETSPSIDDDEDEEPERTERPTRPTEPTSPVAPAEPTLPTETVTDQVPETEALPYVDPNAEPEDIPDEVVQVYYERYVNGDIDLDDIPVGVLGAFFEKGFPMAVLPATGERSMFWTWMMLISLIGLAVTSVLDRKRTK